MTHQVVLQFAEFESLAGYDALIALEDEIERKLPPKSALDGHDSGMGEFNIFVHTDDPEPLFVALLQLVESSMPGKLAAAGYRSFEEEEYHPLWPHGSQHFSVS